MEASRSLRGNTIPSHRETTEMNVNHDLSYNWQTHDREAVRNNPSTAQADSYKIVQDDHFA